MSSGLHIAQHRIQPDFLCLFFGILYQKIKLVL